MGEFPSKKRKLEEISGGFGDLDESFAKPKKTRIDTTDPNL